MNYSIPYYINKLNHKQKISPMNRSTKALFNLFFLFFSLTLPSLSLPPHIFIFLFSFFFCRNEKNNLSMKNKFNIKGSQFFIFLSHSQTTPSTPSSLLLRQKKTHEKKKNFFVIFYSFFFPSFSFINE